MRSNSSSRAAPARDFMALFAVLAMGLGAMASTAAAAPFAYVATADLPGTVSVIDTATNPLSVVATVPVGIGPEGVAVAPDGKHVYVTNVSDSTVSVIDTATNTVVATVPTGIAPGAVAITPDGTLAYVTNRGSSPDFLGSVSVIATATNMVVATVGVGDFGGVGVTPDGKHVYFGESSYVKCFFIDDEWMCLTFGSNSVSVIHTATNKVVATVPMGSAPEGLAVAPDGKQVYVRTLGDTVSVIATATNTVVATVGVGLSGSPAGVAVTPDGTLAYVTNPGSNTVSVIATATNTVVATIPVGNDPIAVAVTPDGKHVYVANLQSNNISVIDTATNMAVDTVPVGTAPFSVAIVPPPPGVPFLAFSANLAITFGGAPIQDSFALQSSFTLSSAAAGAGISPLSEPVTLQVGTFAVTIPPGSFVQTARGIFVFSGVINGVSLEAAIEPTGTLRYAFAAKATGASLTGTMNPVYVTLTVGGNSGATSVTATISNMAPVTAHISR